MNTAEYLLGISESIKDSTRIIVLGDFSFEQASSSQLGKTIVIVATFSEENDELLCFVRRALSQGVPVVAITPLKNTRLASWATFPITEGISTKSDVAVLLGRLLPQDFPHEIIC